MNVDSARLQNSAMTSASIHVGIFGMYMALHLAYPPQASQVLTQVEFLDLHPAPEAAPASAPAVSRPRGVRDFLRMALPSFRSPAPSREPQEVASPKEPSIDHMAPAGKPILIDKAGPIARGPAIKLDAASVRSPSASQLTDIAARSAAPRTADLASVAETKPTLDLEAVGRRVPRGPAGGSIRIDTDAGVARGASMADIATAARAPTAAAAQGGGSGAAIDLHEDAGPARPAGRLPSSLPMGYGPSGGSISLSDRPVGRSAAAVLAEPAKPAAKPQAVAAEMKSTQKGIEISGPLAGRKLLSAALPPYPDWAREKGVEAEAVIRFFVSPDGKVLERMIIERTSGYKELDDLSMEALKKMVFAPLTNGSQEDQWGLVTFRFRLK